MIENLTKIGLSLFLSGLIGIEREVQQKTAGLRTTMLTCFGATLFTIISLLLREVDGNYDLGRIIAYTIVGIGFLGSGVITQKKGNVEGTSTASTLWVSVGVGILVGLGYYALASISTLCVLGVLMLRYIQVKITKNGKPKKK